MLRFGEFRFLRPFLRVELRSYLLGAGLVVLTSVFLVTIPYLVGDAIERLRIGNPAMVPSIALAMVGAVLLRGLTNFWMRRTMISASRRFEYRFRNHLFRHVQRMDADFFSRIHTGDLLSRFTSDVDAVRAAIGPGIMYTFNTFFTLAFALAGMISVSPQLALYSMLPLVFLTGVIRFLGPKVHREATIAQERLSDVTTLAQENFSHIRLLKAYVRGHAELGRMSQSSEAYFEQNMRMIRLRAWTMALLWLFGDLIILFLLALGGMDLIRGEISLGEFAAFKGWQLLLVWPMVALGWVMNLFQRGAASAKRLRSLLDERPQVNDDQADPKGDVTRGSLSFHHTSFAYGDRLVLDNVSATLGAGSTLGVVGATGSGKTTLLQLICRLHDPIQGEVCVDDTPLAEIPIHRLRDAIGYVPQEAFLFSATIRENIAFGVDNASDEAVEEVARLVQIHEEILEFPNGYEQRVGERGITLSGGQKQRIALARALLKRPKILLLDDVLSATDALTEARILQGLRDWTRELTTVIVSHRLSSVRHAKLILVLDEGKVVQRGTHEELLATPGYYADLHAKQVLEDELENL